MEKFGKFFSVWSDCNELLKVAHPLNLQQDCNNPPCLCITKRSFQHFFQSIPIHDDIKKMLDELKTTQSQPEGYSRRPFWQGSLETARSAQTQPNGPHQAVHRQPEPAPCGFLQRHRQGQEYVCDGEGVRTRSCGEQRPFWMWYLIWRCMPFVSFLLEE